MLEVGHEAAPLEDSGSRFDARSHAVHAAELRDGVAVLEEDAL
jgi:hypothetical protein